MENKLEFTPTLKIFLILFIVAGTFLYSVYQKDKYMSFISVTNEMILQEVPDVKLESVYTKEEVSTKELLGKSENGIVFHFWGTWCAPCEVELPSFIELARNYEDKKIKFVLIAINDKIGKIKKFLKRIKNLPKNVIVTIDNNGKSLSDFGTLKVPETFIFKGSGKALKKFVGPQEWGSAYYKDYFNQVLGISTI